MAFGKVVDHIPCIGCKYYDDDDTDMMKNVLCQIDLKSAKSSYEECNTLDPANMKLCTEGKQYGSIYLVSDCSCSCIYLDIYY